MTRQNSRLISFFVLFLLRIGMIHGQEEHFQNGLDLMQAERFDEACKVLEPLALSGQRSHALYFNLATAYLKSDSLAKASFYYELAGRLKPNDRITKLRRDQIAIKVSDEVLITQPFFLIGWARAIQNTLFPNYWFGAALLLFWALVALWAFKLPILSPKWRLRWTGILFCLSLLFLFAAYSRQEVLARSDQLVLMESTPIFTGPDKRSPEKQLILPGRVVIQLNHLPDWYQIQLQGGEQGWVPESKVRIISFPNP